MKALVLLVAVVALGGCGPRIDGTTHAPSGRYAGVGLYPADRTWTKMRAADKPADKASATVSDDQIVIVTVDSNTGELRQCGNMSGYCIGMNPWTRQLGKPQAAPVSVTEHAPEKTVDRQTPASNDAAPADTAEAPSR
jgi:hypothetical protein